MVRTCTRCSQEKDAEKDFYWRFDKRQGKRCPAARCIECDLALKRASHDPDKARAWNLMWRFNLTVEQYDAMLEAQGGVCAICKNPPKNVRLHVDHDHACCPGKRVCGQCVRGLLCWNCNKFLGLLEGHIGAGAQNYLAKWGDR